MLFNSWSFVAFLPIVFALHYLGRSVRWQAGLLTAASFLFYSWGADSGGVAHWKLVPLLAISTLVNSVAAETILSPASSPARRRAAVRLALGFNLGALGVFKYGPFLASQVLPATLWQRWEPVLAKTPLPVGISFYTFQGISLVMECWWAGASGFPGLSAPSSPAVRPWFHLRIWFFKSFFPQLVAGPIVKAGEFFYQITPKRLSKIDWNGAVKRLAMGFFLKMAVADNLKDATDGLHSPEFFAVPRLNLLAMLYGYSFQILADFAGYSLIAQGLGKLFGYELPDNFHLPYLSRGFAEFWRRWHISLSTWLRQYLYLPLGGNRRGAARTYFNLFLVMFLGGLWHGAAWGYAAWGTAHGLLLAIERWWIGDRRRAEPGQWTLGGVARAALVFNVVSLLWLLFQLPRLSDASACLKCLWTNRQPANGPKLFAVALFSLPVILWHLWGAARAWRERWPQTLQQRVSTAVYAAMVFLTAVNSGSPGQFIYFQF